MLFLTRLFPPKHQQEEADTQESWLFKSFGLFCQKNFRRLKPYKGHAGLVGICLGVLLLAVIWHKQGRLESSVYSATHQQMIGISQQMAALQAQLNQLSVNVNDSPQAQTILAHLNETLTDIQKNLMGNAKSADVDTLNQTMREGFDSLTKILAENGQAKTYLEAKTLPFQVISVDVIAEQPFVSVEENHRILPLGMGDSLAGWKLVSADYDAVEVVFENDKGQYVKISTVGQNNET